MPGTLARGGPGCRSPGPLSSFRGRRSDQDEETAHAVAAEWGLELGEPFALSRYSYVAPVGEDRVLKVAWEEDEESLDEAEALVLWDGDGAVRVTEPTSAARAARGARGARHRHSAT